MTIISHQLSDKTAKNPLDSNQLWDKSPHKRNKPNNNNSTWGFLKNPMKEKIQVSPKNNRLSKRGVSWIH